jgi:hypothetical protein
VGKVALDKVPVPTVPSMFSPQGLALKLCQEHTAEVVL